MNNKPTNIALLGGFNPAAVAEGLSPCGRSLFAIDLPGAPADGLLVRSPKVDLAEYPSLRAIARAGAGVDNVDVPAATARGIPVFNTPGANARSVAELAFFALGAFVRRVHVGVVGFADQGVSKSSADSLKKRVGSTHELADKQLGLVGYGAIGRQLASIARAFGMKVLAYDPFARPGDGEGVSYPVPYSVEGLFASCDFVSLHVPLTEDTVGLVGAKALAAAKPGLVLVNTSRSGVCDGAAVKAALEKRDLAGYVTDVDEWEWLGDFDTSALVLPHLGASTEEAQDRCVAAACESLRELFLRGAIRRSVNFPDLDPGEIPEACARIAFANQNTPGALARVLDAVAAHGFNVSDNFHRSRGQVGYGVVDIDKVGPETDHVRWGDLIAEEIAKIPGVLSAFQVG